MTADVPRRTRPDLPNGLRWSDLAATLQRIDDTIEDPYGPSPAQVAVYLAATDADVVRLAEQLEEAGTPDETLIAAELRAATQRTGTPIEVYDPVTGEHLGSIGTDSISWAPVPSAVTPEPARSTWLNRMLSWVYR